MRSRLSAWAVSPLPGVFIALASLSRVRQRWRSRSSTCIRDQKPSITALSQQSPIVPIEGNSPDCLARVVDTQ